MIGAEAAIDAEQFKPPASRASGLGGPHDEQLWPRTVAQCLQYIADGWLPFEGDRYQRLSELPRASQKN